MESFTDSKALHRELMLNNEIASVAYSQTPVFLDFAFQACGLVGVVGGCADFACTFPLFPAIEHCCLVLQLK